MSERMMSQSAAGVTDWRAFWARIMVYYGIDEKRRGWILLTYPSCDSVLKHSSTKAILNDRPYHYPQVI
jgi:hypothetical protein